MTSTPYLKKHLSGFYYIHWTEGRVGKRLSTGTRDQRTAEAKFARHVYQLATGGESLDGIKGSDRTISELWVYYYDHHASRNLADIYLANHVWSLLRTHFRNTIVGDLSQDTVDAYIDRRTGGRLGRKVKPTTAAREISYLVAAVNFCAHKRQGFISSDLAVNFRLPAPSPPRSRWLREQEITALIQAAESMRRGTRLSRLERFIWIALHTAARKDAIVHLTWDRVDLEHRIIDFVEPDRRTTKKRRATVPISDELMPVMSRAYLERLEPNDTGLVLDNPGAIWPQIQDAARKAGLAPNAKRRASGKPRATGISPHVFRHTAATHMARRGVPLFKIAKVLGNSVRMVEMVYAKHQVSDLLDAVNSISRPQAAKSDAE